MKLSKTICKKMHKNINTECCTHYCGNYNYKIARMYGFNSFLFAVCEDCDSAQFIGNSFNLFCFRIYDFIFNNSNGFELEVIGNYSKIIE